MTGLRDVEVTFKFTDLNQDQIRELTALLKQLTDFQDRTKGATS